MFSYLGLVVWFAASDVIYDVCVIMLGCFIVDGFSSLSGVILLGGDFACPATVHANVYVFGVQLDSQLILL